ncbi:arf-GAP with dual PH domain-containing protein 2 [Latimeria chalumnae]|uniref:ArfGAP with dual PH domains 2 n=1 Tax=Latimeria chalumnae TaxID=7897 RepID=H3BB58_LATCH|nr:PREDICTED: arf-GAP with dual PH domain-containing protein 2 isoform X2 [Latimeria chalumnae]|eukprot:XP_005993815.1 PREDICTED: arf-GAP with dual PH domain-containing protein 2 isoform X2 [Latimeria chalumnae]
MFCDRDRNKKVLLDLLQLPGNNQCADCGAPDPDWASYSLGIFICLNCSGIHRNLSGVSKVKSLRLDFWDDSLVEFMKKSGNLLAKEKYEANIPAFYYRPREKDCSVLKEQWIRAKYEREEFTGTNLHQQEAYLTGSREGFLWKRGKDNGQFQKRTFILSAQEGQLRYYVKEALKAPKAIINIKDVNATFQPEKIGNPHGLQITHVKDGQTRNIFVYHESGKEIVDWFNSIRAARLMYLKLAFPTASELDLIPRITRNYLKEGYMEKTGPKQKEAFKKRWFTLDSQERKLCYFKDPLDAFEQGDVFIGSKEHGYEIDGMPSGIKGSKWKYGITIVTPERNFLCTCENESEQKEWIEALKEVILRPMSPQDYSVEASVRRKR